MLLGGYTTVFFLLAHLFLLLDQTDCWAAELTINNNNNIDKSDRKFARSYEVNKLPLLGAICLSLVACEASTVPRFESMSFEELAEYNSGRNISQMIVCGEDQRAFRRVRRRRCMTVEAMYGSAQQASQLGVLHNVPGYARTE